MRRECNRLSKAIHRALESESEALLGKEHDRASKARKRAPESEALPRKEHDRASKAKKRAFRSHRVNRISTTLKFLTEATLEDLEFL